MSDNITNQIPPISLEDQENKLVSLAMQQAATELEAGEASSQVMTHFLKLGTKRNELEMKKLELEMLLIQERIESEKSRQSFEESLSKVLDALKGYTVDQGIYDEYET